MVISSRCSFANCQDFSQFFTQKSPNFFYILCLLHFVLRNGSHQLKAPVGGTVFELKAHDSFVAQPTQPLLEIVPDDALIAEVYIPSKDRGFVRSGMDVDVRVDSFDFSEFGDIPGKLIWVGADALEPD